MAKFNMALSCGHLSASPLQLQGQLVMFIRFRIILENGINGFLKTLPLQTLREKHLIEQRTMGHLHVRACALMGENL